MKAGDLNIKWRYIERDTHKPMTECLLQNGDTLLNRGSAFCNVNDHFVRDKGRKLSLLRAMKNAGMSKEERKVIWELYRNMTPNMRW
uniref:Uncharacterized protein n=1 Tax=viral metagenome TaxID=1070528 RepID=A0A6M3LRG7_9ZZZZ